MKEIKIESRIIARIAYDIEGRRLRIIFKNREQRLFVNVPPEVVGEMVNAPSPGQYYIDRIRTRFERIAA